MSTHSCQWCGGAEALDGSTCPLAIECPTCHRGPGRRCLRPSGHVAPELHATRIYEAERRDQTALERAPQLRLDVGEAQLELDL